MSIVRMMKDVVVIKGRNVDVVIVVRIEMQSRNVDVVRVFRDVVRVVSVEMQMQLE